MVSVEHELDQIRLELAFARDTIARMQQTFTALGAVCQSAASDLSATNPTAATIRMLTAAAAVCAGVGVAQMLTQ